VTRSFKISDLKSAMIAMAELLDWEQETINDFHLYAHRFGASPGCNVFDFALRDALAQRGITLEQLRAEAKL
jgi:hypothetical protein